MMPAKSGSGRAALQAQRARGVAGDRADTCELVGRVGWGRRATAAPGQIQPTTYVCFIGSRPHPFIYLLSMAALMPQLQKGEVVTDTIRPARP